MAGKKNNYMFEEKYRLKKGLFTLIFLSLWIALFILYGLKQNYFYNSLKNNIIETLFFFVAITIYLVNSIWILLGEVMLKIDDKEITLTKILLGFKMSNKYNLQNISEIKIERRKSNRFWGGSGFKIYYNDEEILIIRSHGKEIEIGRGLATFQAKKIYSLLINIKRGTKL